MLSSLQTVRISLVGVLREGGGAVVRVADYGPRGLWFQTWPDRRLVWP